MFANKYTTTTITCSRFLEVKNQPWSVAHPLMFDIRESPPIDLLTSDKWSNYGVSSSQTVQTCQLCHYLIFLFRIRLGCEFFVNKFMGYELF